uniref:CSON007581 protein n=1 Tax=Culicoides sonorensis TaxID=179676 RepID=A0A336M9U4_CULSO
MINTHRYFCCYESLDFWTEKCINNKIHEENLQKLKSTLQIKENAAVKTSIDNTSNFYAINLLQSLSELLANLNLDEADEKREELISVNNFNLIIKVIQEVVNYGLNPLLPEYFRLKLRINTPIVTQTIVKLDEMTKIKRLTDFTKMLRGIFTCKKILAHSGVEFILLELLFSSFYLKSHNIDILKGSEDITDVFTNRSLLFQHLMLLKGLPGVSKEISVLLHKSLLKQLQTNGGFEIFSRLMLAKSESESDWRTYEIISKIVAAKGHSKDFYHEMIQQILKFLRICIGVKELERFIPVCTTCLQKLSQLSLELNQSIANNLTSSLQNLIEPQETLAGTILMTPSEYMDAIKLLNVCFGGSSFASLSSKILIPYLDVLFKLYCLSSDSKKALLSPILMHILNNREPAELKNLIQGILLNEQTDIMRSFDRVLLKYGTDESNPGPSVIVSSEEETPYINLSQCFSEFLIQTSNMLLVTNIFIILLELLTHEMSLKDKNVTKGDLLFDEDETIAELLSMKFMKRLIIIEVLQNLINCKQFQAHINIDPRKILDFVMDMLCNIFKLNENSQIDQDFDTDITMLLITILKELLLCIRNKEIEAEIINFIKKIQRKSTNSDVKQHLDVLFSDFHDKSSQKPSESKYGSAMSLFDQPEVYLKVYGIQKLIQLLNENDKEAIANKHVLLVIALKTLKIDESYAYLNTIRLILALTNVMESEVIDALIAEFENEDLNVEFRMKVGETLVKIAEALGPITFKYKKELINCCLRGCLNSKPELRTSSLSNIGNICKILTYQVTHFFQEILLIIHQIIQTDTFLPARRSAVMVLSQFLQGMDKIIDYQECLLPIYRTLKYVLQTESDEVTRIHAALSIETLNEKVKEMLVGELIKPEIVLKVKNVKKEFEIKYK